MIDNNGITAAIMVGLTFGCAFGLILGHWLTLRSYECVDERIENHQVVCYTYQWHNK